MGESLIRSRILRSKELILSEAREMQGFMDLLMKQRNTGSRWTKGEKVQLKRYIWRLASYVPVLFVFLLPGGLVLIPLLAEILDRRRHRRHALLGPAAQVIEPTPKS